MFLTSLFLAISTSIDSFGIGVTYGLRDTRISHIGKVIIFSTSFIVTLISIWLGDILKGIFSTFLSKFIGSFILLCMGIFMCFQALKKDNLSKHPENFTLYEEEKIYSFFIKFLGITIKIIKNPSSSDFDNSNMIDSKEAIFLSLALSLDSLCIGIGGSIMGINSLILPILVSFFQLTFLSIGTYLGKKILNKKNLPDNIWSILSGMILILIGVFRLF